MPKITFLTNPAIPNVTPQWLTGTHCTVAGVPRVVHRGASDETTWQVSEPITGAHISRFAKTRASAVADAERIVAIVGGHAALLHNMAHFGAIGALAQCTTAGRRPSGAVLHSAELAYLAGGPLDAPEWMPAGSHVGARYNGQSEVAIVRRDAA